MSNDDELKELKDLIILNLKVNSFILSSLVNIKGFSFDSNIVLKLLEDIKNVFKENGKTMT
jgi:hypothetical protein